MIKSVVVVDVFVPRCVVVVVIIIVVVVEVVMVVAQVGLGSSKNVQNKSLLPVLWCSRL